MNDQPRGPIDWARRQQAERETRQTTTPAATRPHGSELTAEEACALADDLTGSCAWPAPDAVWSALNDAQHEALTAGRPLVVVHGACPRGADRHAADWAAVARQFTTSVVEEQHPADWRPGGILDRAAGFRRNAAMVQLGADACLAFIHNGSRGASHAAGLAEAAGIPVRRWTA